MTGQVEMFRACGQPVDECEQRVEIKIGQSVRCRPAVSYAHDFLRNEGCCG